MKDVSIPKILFEGRGRRIEVVFNYELGRTSVSLAEVFFCILLFKMYQGVYDLKLTMPKHSWTKYV